eukprot:11909343-Prorocentrum_lima.AAC.1
MEGSLFWKRKGRERRGRVEGRSSMKDMYRLARGDVFEYGDAVGWVAHRDDGCGCACTCSGRTHVWFAGWHCGM